jgi:hypothetical protein
MATWSSLSCGSPNRVAVFHGCSTAAAAFSGNHIWRKKRELKAGGLS